MLNGTVYYYVLNLQGDVIALVDSTGAEVVTYTYDSWGKLIDIGGTLSGTVGVLNHLRYRGYFYDTETGLYYLQSRYYNPELGRFISGDDPIYHEGETGAAANLYVYCNNNPVNMADPTGHFAIAGVAITIGVVITIITTIFVVAYIFDSGFRNAVNELLYRIFNSFTTTGLGYLVYVINDVVANAITRTKYSGYEVHHIVAENDKRALESMKLIKLNGNGTNDNWTLGTIKKTLHVHLHTSGYHAAVYAFLYLCQYKASNTRQRLIAGLVFIGGLLKVASSMV